MSQLNITNVINISVSQSQTGIGAYNTSNLAIFSREPSAQSSFGVLGYKIYLDPTDVGTDFGTSSETYKMALGVFSQQPNILAGGGYLTVVPFLLTTQTYSFASTPSSGAYTLSYNGNATGSINYNDSAATIQTALRLLTGLSAVTVTGSYTTSFVIVMTGVTNPMSLLVASNTTTVAITIGSSETLDAAITRTSGLVQYFGVMAAEIETQAHMLSAAAVIQTLNKIAFFVSATAADVAPGGTLDLLRTGGLTQSRGLYYGGTTDPLIMMASYAGRALSTNFDGSNTTQTMHLKDLSGVQPDVSTMNQTLLNQCIAAGADVYISIQGVSKVFTSGANSFFDDVYNLRWFVGALEVAGFNFLAETSTKIPQTENAMTAFKNAYRQVCEQAVTNQFSAPGSWTNPVTFGNQSDLIANVAQRGYYIYSSPVSQQSPAVRATRAAPLVQIAVKYAGAMHSGSVIVNVNQ